MPGLPDSIKNRRRARKWSLRQLGEALGITPAYVADLEAGRRQPSVELKKRISTILDISLDEREPMLMPGCQVN